MQQNIEIVEKKMETKDKYNEDCTSSEQKKMLEKNTPNCQKNTKK